MPLLDHFRLTCVAQNRRSLSSIQQNVPLHSLGGWWETCSATKVRSSSEAQATGPSFCDLCNQRGEVFVSAVLSRTRPRSSGLEMKSERSDFGSAQRIVGKRYPSQHPLRQRLTFLWSIPRYSLIAYSRVFYQTLETPRNEAKCRKRTWTAVKLKLD